MKKQGGKSKQAKEKPKKEKQSLPPSPPASEPESGNAFDFGGLPQRDLKKNLGCG